MQRYTMQYVTDKGQEILLHSLGREACDQIEHAQSALGSREFDRFPEYRYVVTEKAHGLKRYLVTVAHFTKDPAKATVHSEAEATSLRDYLRERYRRDGGWVAYGMEQVRP